MNDSNKNTNNIYNFRQAFFVNTKNNPNQTQPIIENKKEKKYDKININKINSNPNITRTKDNFDLHMNDHLDTAADPNHIEKFKIPPELKKTFIIVMILAVLGVTLIICGFIKAISDATPGGGIMFWVLGTVVIIPGGFYSYQFYKAKKAKEEYRRQDILDNIPQL